jgi:uncharacterized protein (TIGR02246 family)|tara:strand:- start:453 stop:839 length:387 start_codon:yes stop_codon:yes gene_type:complete
MNDTGMQTPTEFVQEWIKRVLSNDASHIVLLYKEKAILLGTTDGTVRKGRNSIKEYFDYFVKLRPNVKLKYIVCEEICNGSVVISNGHYDFELYEDERLSTVSARFTFVLEKVGTKWEILSHHSSKIP